MTDFKQWRNWIKKSSQYVRNNYKFIKVKEKNPRKSYSFSRLSGVKWERKDKRLWTWQAPKSTFWRQISALDFASASANHRPESQLGERVSLSAARIQMMSYQMSQPCETLPYSPDFHVKLLAPASFHSHFTPYSLQKTQNLLIENPSKGSSEHILFYFYF